MSAGPILTVHTDPDARVAEYDAHEAALRWARQNVYAMVEETEPGVWTAYVGFVGTGAFEPVLVAPKDSGIGM